MRRLWFLLLLAVLLTGCSEVEGIFGLIKAPEEEEFSDSMFIEPTPENIFPPEMSTAARIVTRGEIVVGVRYDLEPLSYITENSEVAGLEIDLARELARRWLGNPAAVRFRQVRSDSAFQHLEDGSVDIVLAGIVHTQEVEAQADFSPAYFANGIAFLTFPDAGVQNLAELAGRPIGVLSWTGSEAKIEAAGQISPTFTAYDNFFDVVGALRLRQIDVYGDQRHRLERARRMIAGTVIVGQLTQDPVALVYRQDDPFFADLITLTFQDMAADGTRDALYARWLPGTPPPDVAIWPGSEPTPPITQTPNQRSSLDMITRIRDRGTLNVGYFTDRWPYSGDRADGVPTGFEVRLLERVAERWLGSRENLALIPVTANDAIFKLQQGEIDILTGNWQRSRALELQVDFSIPILDDGVSIFSMATAPIPDIASLNGQAVGVVAGSAGEAALPGISQATGVALSPMRYPDFATALAAMSQGAVRALVTERQPALNVHFREAGYAMSDIRYTNRPVVFLVAEGDSEFRDMLNLTLLLLQTNGIYQELYDLWFDDAIPTLQTLPGQPAVPLIITP
ncbi:MAG: transporter substrate-binding domain-containing protein [Anaerolineae bacterium]|nr:transporter substrate-binding domain-containing protein [Anaerolineae bacterium]